jgi:hypothetical protein
MLLYDIIKENSDYYEIDIHNPIDILEFRLTLLPKMKFVKHQVSYLNNDDPVKPDYSNIETNNDSEVLVVRILKPKVGKTIMFKFTTENESGNKSLDDIVLDSFRAGLFTHQFLKKNSNRNWEAKENNDGGITITPV